MDIGQLMDLFFQWYATVSTVSFTSVMGFRVRARPSNTMSDESDAMVVVLFSWPEMTVTPERNTRYQIMLPPPRAYSEALLRANASTAIGTAVFRRGCFDGPIREVCSVVVEVLCCTGYVDTCDGQVIL